MTGQTPGLFRSRRRKHTARIGSRRTTGPRGLGIWPLGRPSVIVIVTRGFGDLLMSFGVCMIHKSAQSTQGRLVKDPLPRWGSVLGGLVATAGFSDGKPGN
jgi:hypothetical protein